MEIEFIKKHKTFFALALKLYNKCFNRINSNRNNTIISDMCFLKHCNINIKGSNNKIIINEFTRMVNCNITIVDNNCEIIIGKRCYLNMADFYIEDDKCRIEIGDHTSIDGKTEMACIEGKSIKIGKDCMFSRNIHIRTGDSHSILNLKGERVNESKDINIGNHVWVGTETIIMKGSIINNDTIIGAGAIVAGKEYPNNSIIAGVPAKVTKSDITWKRERI